MSWFIGEQCSSLLLVVMCSLSSATSVLMIGTIYESLRTHSELLGTPHGQDADDFDVRPIRIIEGLADVLASEEAEWDVELRFCACWILIQLVRYNSGINPSQ